MSVKQNNFKIMQFTAPAIFSYVTFCGNNAIVLVFITPHAIDTSNNYLCAFHCVSHYVLFALNKCC